MKQRGHGAPIRIASCFPSFSPIPFYPPAQPGSADAGAGGGSGPGGVSAWGASPGPSSGLRGWRRPSRSSQGSKGRIFSLPAPPVSLPQKAALLPSNTFYYM